MIQMADDQLFVSKIDKPVKQHDRIASAGDADQIACLKPEPAKQILINLNPVHAVVASNLRRPTMNLQRSVRLDKNRIRRRLQNKKDKHMNNRSIYALLVRSEEKSRDMLETAVYAMCILSVVF